MFLLFIHALAWWGMQINTKKNVASEFCIMPLECDWNLYFCGYVIYVRSGLVFPLSSVFLCRQYMTVRVSGKVTTLAAVFFCDAANNTRILYICFELRSANTTLRECIMQFSVKALSELLYSMFYFI